MQDAPEICKILQSQTPCATTHSCAGDRARVRHQLVEAWRWPNIEINGHHAQVAAFETEIRFGMVEDLDLQLERKDGEFAEVLGRHGPTMPSEVLAASRSGTCDGKALEGPEWISRIGRVATRVGSRGRGIVLLEYSKY